MIAPLSDPLARLRKGHAEPQTDDVNHIDQLTGGYEGACQED